MVEYITRTHSRLNSQSTHTLVSPTYPQCVTGMQQCCKSAWRRRALTKRSTNTSHGWLKCWCTNCCWATRRSQAAARARVWWRVARKNSRMRWWRFSSGRVWHLQLDCFLSQSATACRCLSMREWTPSRLASPMCVFFCLYLSVFLSLSVCLCVCMCVCVFMHVSFGVRVSVFMCVCTRAGCLCTCACTREKVIEKIQKQKAKKRCVDVFVGEEANGWAHGTWVKRSDM